MVATNWTTGDLVTAANLNALEGVVGYVRETGVATHATASRTVSGTITIPSDWTTYVAKVEYALKVESTSATRRIFTVTPKFDGALVTGQSLEHTMENTATKDDLLSGFGFFDAQTSTGSVAFELVLALNASDSSVTSDNIMVFATAWRLT